MPNDPMQALIEQLMAGAGPRGAMFMGRHVGQMRSGEAPDTLELLSRIPSDMPDAEGMGGLGMTLGGAGMVRRMPRGGTMPNFEGNVDYGSVAGGAIKDINSIHPLITKAVESDDPVEIAIKTVLEHGPDRVAKEMLPRYAGANHGIAALIRLAEQLGQLPRNMADDLLKWADANIKEHIGPKVTKAVSEGENMQMRALIKKQGGE